MRLAIISILMFFTSCGFSQRYQVKEAFFYPDITSEEVYKSAYPTEILIIGKEIFIRDSLIEYIIVKGKFLEKVPMKGGGHLNAYEAKIGDQPFLIGFWYSRRGQFLAIQLKKVHRIMVFIIDYGIENL